MYPNIGIVIPVGNSESHIGIFMEKYLNCVKKYKGTVNTVLICNNATKLCVEKLQNYASDNIKIFEIETKHCGISQARNCGIDMLPSDVSYIGFIDDDDSFVENTFENIDKYLTGESDIICFGWNNYDGDKNHEIAGFESLPRNFLVDGDYVVSRDIVKYLILPRNVQYLGYVWGKMFKADFIFKNNIKFNDQIYTFEDVLFLFQSILLANKIKFVNIALVNQNWVIKPEKNKASFAGYNLKMGMGFVEVARFLQSNACGEAFDNYVYKQELLTRYCGYLFYFNLIRASSNLNFKELFKIFFDARKLVIEMDAEFDQSNYKVIPDTGESIVIGYLNSSKMWTLAIIFCLAFVKMKRHL